MFNKTQFLEDVKTFIGFKTIVCQKRGEFLKANAWIRDFFDSDTTEFIDFECHGLVSNIIKPRDSVRDIPGDGHIEVVPLLNKTLEPRRSRAMSFCRLSCSYG